MPDQVSATGPLYRPSYDDDQKMDPGTLRILVIMGLGGLAILAGIAVYSLSGRSGGGTLPVVEADTRPIRVKPENAGGMAVNLEEKKADPNQSRLAPAPEEPRPLASAAARDSVPSAALMQSRPKSIAVQFTAAKTEAEAQAIWERLAKRMPDVLGSHRPLFQKTSEPGVAPWRLRTGGFTDPARAKAFCGQVVAKGGTCALVES